jgi:Ca-activated chloride channel family protein
VLVLAVGTSNGGAVRAGRTGYARDARGGRVIATLDRKGLEALERQAGAFVVGVTADNRDVQQINRRVDTSLKSVQAIDNRIPWEDVGYYACFLALPLSLVWFRKGWTVRWQ